MLQIDRVVVAVLVAAEDAIDFGQTLPSNVQKKKIKAMSSSFELNCKYYFYLRNSIRFIF